MADGPLTPERILEASEDVLRRYGPAKATVVDVARELGVSHGSVYRHFPSKAALRDAVAERWLAAVSEPLAEIANEDGAAAERLRRWLDLLVSSKQDRARDDPELFATYVEIAGESREVITEHVDATRRAARADHRRRRRAGSLRRDRRTGGGSCRLRRNRSLPQPR